MSMRPVVIVTKSRTREFDLEGAVDSCNCQGCMMCYYCALPTARNRFG